jgi:hypothetical protein
MRWPGFLVGVRNRVKRDCLIVSSPPALRPGVLAGARNRAERKHQRCKQGERECNAEQGSADIAAAR